MRSSRMTRPSRGCTQGWAEDCSRSRSRSPVTAQQSRAGHRIGISPTALHAGGRLRVPRRGPPAGMRCAADGGVWPEVRRRVEPCSLLGYPGTPARRRPASVTGTDRDERRACVPAPTRGRGLGRKRGGGWRPGGRRRRRCPPTPLRSKRHEPADHRESHHAVHRHQRPPRRPRGRSTPPRPAASSSSAWTRSTKCSDGSKAASEHAGGLVRRPQRPGRAAQSTSRAPDQVTSIDGRGSRRVGQVRTWQALPCVTCAPCSSLPGHRWPEGLASGHGQPPRRRRRRVTRQGRSASAGPAKRVDSVTAVA